MKFVPPSLLVAFAFALVGCSSAPDAHTNANDAAAIVEDASADAAAEAAADAASCPSYVDDAGVTHGCNRGGQGPGDRDDGGGIETGAPDVAMDASDLPFGSPCWNDAQCASMICFDFRVKGQFCTQSCRTNADCPSTSLGCSGMGFCRVGN